MLRSGRFRHRLLDEAFLENHSAQAYQSLQPFLQLWEKNILSDAEVSAVYVWIFSFLRRPQDFLGGVIKDSVTVDVPSRISSAEAVQILRSTLPDSLKSSKALSRFEVQKPFISHFCSHSLRSIPFSVNRSLLQWQLRQYPLKLMTHVPSVDDVMNMQIEGCRCVSMLIAQDEIQNFVLEGRDVLGFIIHDLIHADHFFHDRENADAQIHFSRKLKGVRSLNVIQDMWQRDSRFVSEFEYLMSDMNSVPLHLLKSLKAVLLGYFKRREGLAMGSPLSDSAEHEFRFLFETVLAPWDFSEAALAAAHRLNTPLYLSPADSLVLDSELRPKRLCDGAFSLS